MTVGTHDTRGKLNEALEEVLEAQMYILWGFELLGTNKGRYFKNKEILMFRRRRKRLQKYLTFKFFINETEDE